ncbi:MAG: protein kinase [Thermoanaerobaculia bacterium]
MIKKIGKYEILSLLGEGGLSFVYKAFDPVLQRYVAIKVLKVRDEQLIKRFFREAKVQSSLEGDYICKIYEFGEVDNIPYIVMQFINGISLKDAIKDLNLEKKLIIFKKICEALQEAHQKGFIHRDIKPSNILIEFKEDGDVKPYIIDFGLVKEEEKRDFSFTGMVFGTVGFMAPEQLKGKPEEIDRRTDIYGIGVTLYFSLTGKKPFEVEEIEEFEKAIKEEPVPLRKIKKDIPKDLEAIVMKCLRFEKEKRYQNVRELKEDIDNFLKGEPVKAKTLGIFYGISKKIRKNKTLFYFSLVFLILISLFLIFSINIKNFERKQRILAIEFSQQVKNLEDMLWYIYSSKVHNLKPEMDFIKERFKQIEKNFKSYGKVGYGPAHYAMGKAYLILGDFKKARENFDLSSKKYNFKASDIPYFLSLSSIMLYFEEREKILRIEDRDLKERMLLKLDDEYFSGIEKNLSELKNNEREGVEFLEALIYFYSKNYDLSLKKIGKLKEKYPYLLESLKLEGKIYKTLGDVFSIKGLKEEAIKNYLKAEEIFKEIQEKRESDPEIYKLLSSLWFSQMDLRIYQSGTSPEDLFQKVNLNCEKLLNLNIDLEEPYKILAYSNLKMGSFYLYEGKEPLKFFENALLNSSKALELKNDDYRAHWLSGSSLHSIGAYKRSIGENPTVEFERSIQSFKKAISLNPYDTNLHNEIALAFWNLGAFKSEMGLDPRDSLREGLLYIEKAKKMEKESGPLYNTAGNLYLEYAYFESSNKGNSEVFLNRAIENYKEAIKLNPNFAISYNNLGECYLVKFENQGEEEDFKKGIDYIEKGIKIKPDFIWFYVSQARLRILKIRYKMEKGEEIKGDFEELLKVLKKGEEIEKFSLPFFELKGEYYKIKSNYEKEKGKDFIKTLKEGIGEMDKIIKVKEANAKIYGLRGELYFLMGDLEKAKKDIEKAIKLSPALKKELRYILK